MSVFAIDSSKAIQQTLAIIKPDAVKSNQEDAIMSRCVDEGFTIIAQLRTCLTEEQIETIYERQKFMPHYGELKQFLKRLVIGATSFNLFQ